MMERSQPSPPVVVVENKKVVINVLPSGPLQDDTFRVVEESLLITDAVKDGSVVVEVDHVSIDPTNKIWLEPKKTYLKPLHPGDAMRAPGVGRVVASGSPRFRPGDWVLGADLGWQRYAAVRRGRGLTKLPAPRPGGPPPTAFLGVLGHTGMAAYFGLLDVGNPKPGETVVISGAAGATGSVAGQIAKIKGCRVVGIAGSREKCAWLRGLGFDVALDYRAPGFRRDLAAAVPRGVDVYFDNVGGPMLDLILGRLARGGRVVVCGAISGYQASGGKGEVAYGPKNYLNLINQSGRMQGFLVMDYTKRFPEAVRALSQWLAQGRLQHREHVVEGVENAPRALAMLFEGGNRGKLLVRVAAAAARQSTFSLVPTGEPGAEEPRSKL